MNAQQKKEMKRKSLKKELRDAKFRFWQLEEKYVYWLVRNVRLPLPDKKWQKYEDRKRLAKAEMKEAENEMKLAQVEWDRFQRIEKKRAEKVVKKKVKTKRR